MPAALSFKPCQRSAATASMVMAVRYTLLPETSASMRPLTIDALLDRAAADELVHQHVLRLPEAERAVGRLVFDRRIPPAIEVHDMRGRRQVEASAARLE